MRKLKNSLNDSSLLEADVQALDTKAWRDLMEGLESGSQQWPTATVLFTAFHNLVTDSVSDKWMPASRRQYYCPSQLVEHLKAGIFSTDKEVLSKDSDTFTHVPASISASFPIPGMTPIHRLVNCTNTKA